MDYLVYHMKSFMYDADNLSDLKKKLQSYEIQQLTLKEIKSERNKFEEKKTLCFNCGDKSHPLSSCPFSQQGPKCFRCNMFGHRSDSCSLPKQEKKTFGKMNLITLPDGEATKPKRTELTLSQLADMNAEEVDEWTN